jgi:hypothetical protein
MATSTNDLKIVVKATDMDENEIVIINYIIN